MVIYQYYAMLPGVITLLSYFDTYQQVCCLAGAQRSQYELDWYSVYNHQQHIAITISNTIRSFSVYT